MAALSEFLELFYGELGKVGVRRPQCDFDEARGLLVMNVGKGGDGRTRVVPIKALAAHYAACSGEEEKLGVLKAAVGAFGEGFADVPREYAECGIALLPQLWPVGKIRSLELGGVEVPHCGLHGESSQEVQELGVVLVYEHLAAIGTGTAASLPVETPVLSGDLSRWGVAFVDALQGALDNLRSRTKNGPPTEMRWEHHTSGCGQTCWGDRFDSARAALLPALVARRRRPEGQVDAGGHVVAFATPSCVFATMSKNPIGLCFMGETLHVKMVQGSGAEGAVQRLSTTPYRLLKKRDDTAESGEGADSKATKATKQHPLNQKAGEGLVWRWMPYSPGGPPLRSPGEFSVPVDIGEVDGILNAIEHGKPVPVFSHSSPGDAGAAQLSFAAKKEAANRLFKSGEFVKAIAAYDAALKAPPPTDADAAVIHSNAAQALLNLAAADVPRREACAAESLRRASTALELDPSNVKACARCAAACDILGEADAAADFRARAVNGSGGS